MRARARVRVCLRVSVYVYLCVCVKLRIVLLPDLCASIVALVGRGRQEFCFGEIERRVLAIAGARLSVRFFVLSYTYRLHRTCFIVVCLRCGV